jgi:hypothetical protein
MRQDAEAAAYKIFRILRDGEKLYLASRGDPTEAKRLVDWFTERWPGEYFIQEADNLKSGKHAPEMNRKVRRGAA